jgi:hypothetical protein
VSEGLLSMLCVYRLRRSEGLLSVSWWSMALRWSRKAICGCWMRRSSAFLESAECLSRFFRLSVTRSNEITLATKASTGGVSLYAGRASGLNALLYAIVERKSSRFRSAGTRSLLSVDFAGRQTMKLKAHLWQLKGKSLWASGLWFLAGSEAVRSTRVGELFRKRNRQANNGIQQ